MVYWVALSQAASLTIVAAIISAGTASACLPPGPPKDYSVSSANGQCEAKVTAAPARITVYRKHDGVESPEWSMNGFRWGVCLANDCTHLVIISDPIWAASEKVPRPEVADAIAFRIFARGKLVREVKVGEFTPDLSKLTRGASYWFWGFAASPPINNRNEFVVWRDLEHKALYFDVSSGNLIRTEWFFRPWLFDLVVGHPMRIALGAAILGAVSGLCGGGKLPRALLIGGAVATAYYVLTMWFILSRISPSGEWLGWKNAATALLMLLLLALLPSTATVAIFCLGWTRIRRLAGRPRLRPSV